MLAKYYIMVLLIPVNYTFTAQLPEQQQPTLKKQQDSYLSLSPNYTKQAIDISNTIEEAINKIKILAQVSEHVHYFKDLTFIDSVINALVAKFPGYLTPEEIAARFQTESSQSWLKEIRPLQIKLLEAAEQGNVEQVKKLIDQGVNSNARWGVIALTPLIFAVKSGSLEVVRYLLEHGADVNSLAFHALAYKGWSALHEAAYKNHPEIVKLLLKYGADPYLKANKKFTALDLAKQRGYQEVYNILQKALTKEINTF